MQSLFYSLGLISGGLLVGYLWQLAEKGKNDDFSDERIARLRKLLQKIGLLVFMPVSFVAAVWIVSFVDLKLAALPLIGLLALLAGGVLGLGSARLLGRRGPQAGTLYCCGSFTNIGSIGALVAFVFLGEEGFGLVALYKMFEEISYYTIGFPVARYYSGDTQGAGFADRLRKIAQDPFVRAAVLAFCCGLVLNLSGLERPAFFAALNSFLVPAGTFVLLISIGLGMRFSSVTDYWREGLAVSLIKFLMVPALVFALASLLGFGAIDGGLPLKAVLIASSMPVAFTALVAASVFELDLDLANACWLISTAALVVIIPWLSFLLGQLS
jgi:predicted permease